jgi:uncharacterized protein with von Willebrand factor type A (vWA) domain
MTYCDIKEGSDSLQKAEQGDFPTLVNLLFDAFNSFYKYSPKFYDDPEIREDFIINKEILSKAMQSEQYKKLRAITQLDEVNSAVATVSFVQELIKELEKRQPDIKEKVYDLQDQQDELAKAIQQLSQAQQSGDQRQVQQAQQAVSQIQNQIQHSVQQIKKSVPQVAVSHALHKSAEKATEINNSMNALSWGSEASSLKKVSPEERIKLAERLMKSQKLFKLVKELGRMKRLAIASRREKIKQQSNEVYDIETGDNLNRVIPAELVKLSHPSFRLDFLRRFSEKQLLQYALREREEKGKGPIVCCLDLSGSMYDEKEIWAKAVALATLELAMREKRGYEIIIFSEEVKMVREFERGHTPNIQNIIEIADANYGGGTDFKDPLTHAMKAVEERGKKKADILFITDGEAGISPEFEDKFNEFKDKTGTKVISVQIGGGTYTLEKFSDKIIEVEDFFDAAKEVFTSF